MSNTLVQFRAEESSRVQAVSICNKLGIDLATYLRMCMARLVQENGIPFTMKIETDDSGISAMKAASCIAKSRGLEEMSLDEINAEIAEARK